jgi:hypothetical protein
MKREIFEGHPPTHSLVVDSTASQRTHAEFTAPPNDQRDRASKRIDDTSKTETQVDFGNARDQIHEAGGVIIENDASVYRLLLTIRAFPP